jgi:hypothetical protein
MRELLKLYQIWVGVGLLILSQFFSWGLPMIITPTFHNGILITIIGVFVSAPFFIWAYKLYRHQKKTPQELLGKYPIQHLQNQSLAEIILEAEYDKLRESLISAKERAEGLLEIWADTDITNFQSRERMAITDARDRFGVAVNNLKKERSHHSEFKPIIVPLINTLQTGQARLNRIIKFNKTLGSSKSKVDENAKDIIRKIGDIIGAKPDAVEEFFFEPTGSGITTKTGIEHLQVTFRARPKVIVDTLHLDINGLRFAPLEWSPFSVSPQYTSYWAFDLSDKLEKGKTYIGKLIVTVDGREHKSRDFSVHT